MGSLNKKISSLWQKTRSAWPFFGFLKKTPLSQEDIDKKLIYSLAPRKIPSGEQIKHLPKFLKPRESLIVKICALVILANVIYLGAVFIKKHVQYSPASGGEYIEGAVGYPETINPLYAANRDVDGDLSRLIYSSLVKYDDNGKLVNDLAAAINISADGKEYDIKIKPGVKFHNGEPLTADDVLFTFNTIKNPDYRSPLLSSLTGVEAAKVDDLTIKFTLAAPYAPFLELLTFGVLPKDIWENISPNFAALSDLNLKPIGSGPYKFKSLVKNQDGDLKEYHLTVNSDYYGPAPYIKNFTFDFFVDYQEAISALNDNKIMGLSYLPFASRPDVLAKNSVAFRELAQPQIVSLFFNYSKNKSLADKNIRLALADALDKDQIINDVFGGAYQRADGPLLKENFAYDPNLKIYNYDAAAAAETIKSKPLTVALTVVDSGQNVAVANDIKNYWEAVGVHVALNIISGDQAGDVIKNRNFEVLLYGESVGGDPDVYAFWHSSQINDPGLNLAGYSNPEVDKLLADARTTMNLNDRVAEYQKFQEILTADLPAIFLYSPTYTYVQSRELQGFSGTMITVPADRFSSVSDWYVKTKKTITW